MSRGNPRPLGRGGSQSHAYHFRVVKPASGGGAELLVRHGGGEERIRLSNSRPVLQALEAMDTNARYWMLHAIYHAQADSRLAARGKESDRWSRAAAEKRIKVRKVRGRDSYKVTIEN